MVNIDPRTGAVAPTFGRLRILAFALVLVLAAVGLALRPASTVVEADAVELHAVELIDDCPCAHDSATETAGATDDDDSNTQQR